MKTTTVTPLRVGRRALLRGAVGGVAGTLALPRLDAMLNGNGTAYAAGGALPRLYGTFFWGNGIDPKRWVPTGMGTDWSPGEQLMPLMPVKSKVSVVTGLRLRPPRTNEPHVNGPVGLLTGDDFQGAGFQDGTVKKPSLDQIIARKYLGETRLRSLEMRISAYHGGGTAIDHISHNGPGNPNRGEIDPKVIYMRLFGGEFTGGAANSAQVALENNLRKSALDVLSQDARALRARVGKADQVRLDQHLEGIRALETRLKAIAPTSGPALAACQKPAAPGAVDTLRKRSDVMARLLAMAYACDLTRVASFEFSTPASHISYPEVGVREDIHEWGHKNGVDATVNTAIVFFMQTLASFLTILQETPDAAGGTVLDRALILGTSCTAYGPTHGYTDWPILLCGRAGGGLKAGVHLRPLASDDSASRVPLTILRIMGIDAPDWGVGPLATNKPLTELLA